MDQRRTPYNIPFLPPNYNFTQLAAQARAQQQQGQYPASPVQYGVPTQHAQSSYYPNIPSNTTVTQQAPPTTLQTRPAAATRRRNNAGQITPPAPVIEVPAAPAAEPDSPEATAFDGETTLNFQDGEDNNDDSGPVFHLPPPPESTYPSDKDLEKAMHAWSLEHGYELVRRASKKNSKGVLYKRYYHCSKHGKIANTGKLTDETRVRVNRKSNRIGCPMSLAAVAVDPSNPAGEWQIRHRKIDHNHGPMEAVKLAGHRRRARVGGVEKAVDGLFAIGTPTAQVLTFLQRTNPSGLFTRTDVANMKLKYKKFGTCIDQKDGSGDTSETGRGVACNSCRDKKSRCDTQKPTCSTCIQHARDCQYPFSFDTNDLPPPDMESSVGASRAVQASTSRAVAQPAVPPQRRPEAIMAELESFRASHVRPTKLNLQSSSVEVLAAASCGNGESYRNVPALENVEQWIVFRNAIADASMKENTFEVLTGAKIEPTKPADEKDIEEWNEYIKQLAIFNRRNTALLGALLPRLSSHFRPRVQHIQKAAEVWSVLEELCQPRGSDRAYRLYLELHSITLQSCAGLRDYSTRLEAACVAFNRVSRGGEVTSARPRTGSQAVQKPEATFSEDMLCFLLMRNLGPAFKQWADNICRSGNVASFGSGRRIGYADLTRSACEWEALHHGTMT